MIIFHICMIDCGIGNVHFCLKIESTSFCSCSYRELNFAVADIKTEFCSYSN